MDKRSIDKSLTEAKSLVEVVEALLREAKIPLIRGRLRDDGITVVDVDRVDRRPKQSSLKREGKVVTPPLSTDAGCCDRGWARPAAVCEAK